MIEFVASLMGIMFIAGFLALLAAVVIVPLIIVFKIVGFGLRAVFSVVGALVAAVVVLPLAAIALPVMAFVGGLLILKLLILATPLLLLGLLIWALVTLVGRPTPRGRPDRLPAP